MKAPDYLAVNPMGKVPALRRGAAVVTEAAAICAYLPDALPHRGLLPQTVAERAAYFRLREGPFVCGERFTAADAYVGSGVSWGLLFGTIEKRPSFEAYVVRLVVRPAYGRAVRINEARLKTGGAAV